MSQLAGHLFVVVVCSAGALWLNFKRLQRIAKAKPYDFDFIQDVTLLSLAAVACIYGVALGAAAVGQDLIKLFG
jgi:hypothetical protein